MTNFAIADLHFGHTNIIKHDKRPFASADEMDEVMTANWNRVVTPVDTVYVLGDISLSRNRDYLSGVLHSLNGKIILIKGNHDRLEALPMERIAEVHQMLEIRPLVNEVRQRITLCHYAMRTWNHVRHGSWMLHGHSHGNLPDLGGKTLDLGANLCNYTPVSFETIADVMEDRPVYAEDHHTNQ